MFHHRLILADRCIHCESDASGFALLFVDNHASVVPMRKKTISEDGATQEFLPSSSSPKKANVFLHRARAKSTAKLSHNESGGGGGTGEHNILRRAARCVLNGSAVSHRHCDGCSRLSRAAPPAAISFLLSSHLSVPAAPAMKNCLCR